MRIFAAAAIMLGWMGTALGEEVTAPGNADKPAQQARVRELRTQATEIRQAAEKKHDEAQVTCWKKFFVTACHDDAKKELQVRQAEARKLEAEAREIDRLLRKRDIEEREAQRVEEAPRREEAAAKRAEKNRQDQEAAMQRVEKRQAEAAQREAERHPIVHN